MAQGVNFTLPTPVSRAMGQLHSAGFEAYIVGGCVRDMLMGRVPNDFDITTSALPTEIQQVFSGEKMVLTGLKHGTVSVCLDGMYFEITTYRIDGDYLDGRHPEKVSFTAKLEEDLARRDYTINAIAYSPEAGVLDFHDGQRDLAAGKIRTVGDPTRRFSEDALRMLRAYRFASVLNFTIEDETRKTAARMFGEIEKVSPERITAEFMRLLEGPGAGNVLAASPEILEVILRFSQVSPDCGDMVDSLSQVFHQRLAALILQEFLLTGKMPLASLLRLDRKTDRFVKDVIALASAFPAPDGYKAKCLLQKYGVQPLEEMLQVLHAVPFQESAVTETMRIVRTLVASDACYSFKQLAINGADVMSLRHCGGRETGRILAALLQEVMLDILPNDRDILLAKIIDT